MKMSKIESIKSNLDHKDVIVLDGMLFLNEENLDKYLDTCDAEYLASEEYFAPTVDAMLKQGWFSEEEMRSWYGLPDYSDPDYDEDEYEDEEDEYQAAIDQYDDQVDNLLDRYNIDYNHKNWGAHYLLSGTYGDLKKFAQRYGNHLDMEDAGEALYDLADNCTLDIGSGDDNYILGRL